MVDQSLNVTATNDNWSVYEGEDMTLSCNTSHNWKTCGWLYDQKSCQFEYTYDENNVVSPWSYKKMICDSNFGGYDFITPNQGSDLGNKNKECRIEFKRVSYEGEYKCKFQRCNPEENDYCKTKVSPNVSVFSASIFVKVKLPD